MSGYGGGSQAKLTTAELQVKAVEWFDRLASEDLRIKVAQRLVAPTTLPQVRGLLGRSLLGPSPLNVAAQVVLVASPATDQNTKGDIERQFTLHSSDALAVLLGVPFKATLTAGGGRGPGSGGRGPGYGGASGMPPGYGGASGMPPGYSGASRMPPQGGSRDGDDPTPYPGSTMPYGQQPPAGYGMTPTTTGYGSAPSLLGVAGAGPEGVLSAVARDQSYRVAQQLWGKQLSGVIEAQLDQTESLQQGAGRVLLASTVPTDAVRAKLYKTLLRSWDEGPRALEDGGLGTSLLSDPGFLVVMKGLPRKDVPTQEAPKRIRRSSRRQQGNPGGPGGPGQPYMAPGTDGGPYGGRGPAQPKDVDKPDYNWMEACESLVRGMCDQYLPEGKRRVTSGRGAGAELEEKRPVTIPNNVKPVAEYRFEWPQEVSSARTKLAGVPLDSMTVYYARLAVNSAPAKALAYYRRQLGRPAEHQADVGYWLESIRTVGDSDRQLSIDVLICRREERGGAKTARPGGPGHGTPYGQPPGMGPGSGSGSGSGGYGGYGSGGTGGTGGRSGAAAEKVEKDAPVDLIVEILAVEIKDPTGGQGPAKNPKEKRAAQADVFGT
jgi:hypothetical protein